MEKVLTIITIMVILLSISIISNAAVEITEEKLEESFNKILENSEESANYSFHKEDNIIIIKEDETAFGLKYNLDDKPTFYAYMIFEDNMTEEEARQEIEQTGLPFMGFLLISDIMGINIEDSSMYFFLKYMGALMEYDNNQNLEYTNAIEYAKRFYPNETNTIINDKLFNLTVHKQLIYECAFKVELTVNIEEDFSILDGTAEKNAEEIIGQFKDALENGQFSDEFENLWNEINATRNETGSTNENEIGSINGNEENTVITDNNITNTDKNNVVANIQKIPQTGNEISIENILYLVIIVSSLLGICLTIYNKKTSK